MLKILMHVRSFVKRTFFYVVVCPRDEITGACLTLEDTQCEIDTVSRLNDFKEQKDK